MKVEKSVLTVKTAKGNVDVKLSDKTEITKNNHRPGLCDLKPGTRVVVDVLAGSKDKVAHSIQIGISGPVEAHPHANGK